MNEDQLNALANTIYLYESGQIDLTNDQVRDLKQMADAVGFSFSPDFSAGRAALAATNEILFGIPGAAAGLVGQSEIFEPMTTGESFAKGAGSLVSLLLGGGILKKLAGPLVSTALRSKAGRDAAVRTAAALRSTGLPGTRRAAQAVTRRGNAMQEAITSGLGYGGAGGLQGLFDPEGTLLGGFAENALYGALAPVGGKLLGKAKSASKAARGSSPAKASDINMERVKEVAEELRVQEAMEQAAAAQSAAQAAAAQAAAASAIMRLRGSSRAVRGANFTPNSKGLFARLEEAFDTGANSLNSLFGGTPREQFMREMRLRDIGSAKLRQSYLRQGTPGYSNRPYPLPRTPYSEQDKYW